MTVTVKWCETTGGSQCTQIFSGFIPGAPNYEDIEVSGSVRGALSLVVEVNKAGDTTCDAQYLEIWVGTFPELVIKQSSGVGQTLNWSCQRIS